MNDLRELSGEIRPIAALVAYQNGNQTYFESHEIKEGKIGAGKPASTETLQKIKALFEEVDEKIYETIQGIIPRNLLYINSDKTNPILIFHTPVQKVRLHFTKSLKIVSKEYYVPKLLWIFNGGEISIYALRTSTMKSKVYHAPFFNVYEDGKVCMGNVEMQKSFSEISTAIEKIQNYFFSSQFNQHVNVDKGFKVPLDHFWQNRTELWKDNDLFVRNKQFKTIQHVIDQFERN